MTKLSVIVPVYNVEEYLKDSLDSLLAQSFQDMEVILINDGSRDDSGQILKEYKDKDERIVLIEKPNGGVDTARNAGLDAAKGKYIAFYDPDDKADRNLYMKLIKSLEANESELAVCGYKTILKNGQTDEVVMDIESGTRVGKAAGRRQAINDFLKNPNHIGWALWNKLYIRKIIEENNIRFKSHKEIFAEDVFFNLEYLTKVENISLVDESLYIYRIRPLSIMSTYVESYPDKIRRYVITTAEFLREKNLQKTTREAFGIHAYNYVITTIKLVKCDPRGTPAKYREISKLIKDEKLREILSEFKGGGLSLKGRILHLLYEKRLPALAFAAIMLFVSRQNLCPQCGDNLE